MNEAKTWHLPQGLEQWLAPFLRNSQRSLVLVLCFLAGLGLFLLLMTRSAVPQQPAASQEAVSGGSDRAAEDAGDRLERELAAVLQEVAGAGRVSVRLTLAASESNEWEQNKRSNRRTVEDRTQDGGVQVTSEETIETTLALARRPDGSEAPVAAVAKAPRVAGAIIVADGADDPRVRADLARAAAVFLGLGLHRIAVLAQEAER